MKVHLSDEKAMDLINALGKAPMVVSKHVRVAMMNSLEDFRDRMIDEAPKAKKQASDEYPIDDPFGVNRSMLRSLHQAIDVEHTGAFAGRVFVDRTLAPHAVHVVTGRPAMFIKPVEKETLRWVDPKTGRFVYSRGHQVGAVDPNPFPNRALDAGWGPHQKRLGDAMRAAIVEAGV